MERKQFQLQQAFLNSASQLTKSVSPAAAPEPDSENIETSMMGTTPAKPQFEQSALKQKQQTRLYHREQDDSIERHNKPYS